MTLESEQTAKVIAAIAALGITLAFTATSCNNCPPPSGAAMGSSSPSTSVSSGTEAASASASTRIEPPAAVASAGSPSVDDEQPTAGTKADDNPCEKEETQLDMNFCWADAAKKRDGKLRKAIKGLEKLLGEQEDKTLIGRQRGAESSWEAYREAHCKLQQDRFAGGSMAPMTYWICRYEMARSRLADVELLAEQWSPH